MTMLTKVDNNQGTYDEVTSEILEGYDPMDSIFEHETVYYLFLGESQLEDNSLENKGQRFEIIEYSSIEGIRIWLKNQVNNDPSHLGAICINSEWLGSKGWILFKKYLDSSPFLYTPVIMISLDSNDQNIMEAKSLGFDAVWKQPYPIDEIHKRSKILRRIKIINVNEATNTSPIPLSNGQGLKYHRNSFTLKRASDVAISGLGLLILSPILLISALIIKLESPGPVFYISKRAGAGYQIFDFYKLRSMGINAAKELDGLRHLNQYAGTNGENTNGSSAFIKIKDDPRITKFGLLLRKTSLDEIPQLFNVLKGDMSLVGNRPLPLYEAEQLTKDHIALRFLAPAGITGLWQISKRGKDDMSPEERMELDMNYAMKNSFWKDIEILVKTIPAMIQKEKV